MVNLALKRLISKIFMGTYFEVYHGRGGKVGFRIKYRSMFLGIAKFKTDAP